MKKEKIEVIIKEPYCKPELKEIDNTLEAMQEIVQGYIEAVTISDKFLPEPFVVICNEEGRLHNMEYNFTLAGNAFVGPVIVAGEDGDEFTDAPDSAFETFMRWNA